MVMPELPQPDKEHAAALGDIRHGEQLCVDTLGVKNGGPIGTFACHGGGGNQGFFMMRPPDSRIFSFAGTMCLVKTQSAEPTAPHLVGLDACDDADSKWQHPANGGPWYVSMIVLEMHAHTGTMQLGALCVVRDTGPLQHVASGQCLGVRSQKELVVEPCRAGDVSQQWRFSRYY